MSAACAATAKSAPATPASTVCINFMRPPRCERCERITRTPRSLGALCDSNVTVRDGDVTMALRAERLAGQTHRRLRDVDDDVLKIRRKRPGANVCAGNARQRAPKVSRRERAAGSNTAGTDSRRLAYVRLASAAPNVQAAGRRTVVPPLRQPG